MNKDELRELNEHIVADLKTWPEVRSVKLRKNDYVVEFQPLIYHALNNKVPSQRWTITAPIKYRVPIMEDLRETHSDDREGIYPRAIWPMTGGRPNISLPYGYVAQTYHNVGICWGTAHFVPDNPFQWPHMLLQFHSAINSHHFNEDRIARRWWRDHGDTFFHSRKPYAIIEPRRGIIDNHKVVRLHKKDIKELLDSERFTGKGICPLVQEG